MQTVVASRWRIGSCRFSSTPEFADAGRERARGGDATNEAGNATGRACKPLREGRYRMLQLNTPHKPRLLIMDEDRIMLQSLAQFLSREGYEVRTTDEADEAFSILEGTQIEVLLADVN